MPKNVDWESMRKLYVVPSSNYLEFITIKGGGPTTLEQSTSVNSRVNFETKFSWKVPVKNSVVQEERVVSTILLIEKVMMTLSNSYNLRSRARGADISKIERVATIKKLSDYESNIYSIMREKEERIYDRKFDFRERSSPSFSEIMSRF
jgi:hypothetical protein